MHGKSDEEERKVMKLSMDCNGLIRRVAACSPNSGGRFSLNVAATPQPAAPSLPPRTSLQSNPFRMDSLIDLDDPISEQTPLQAYDHRRVEVNWADFGATGTSGPPETSSPIATRTDFTNRSQFPSARAAFLTSENIVAGSDGLGETQRVRTVDSIQRDTAVAPQLSFSTRRPSQQCLNANDEAASRSRVSVDDGAFDEFQLYDNFQFRRASQASFMISTNNSQVRPMQGERDHQEYRPIESRARQDPQANRQQSEYVRHRSFAGPQAKEQQPEYGRDRNFGNPPYNRQQAEYGCDRNVFFDEQANAHPRQFEADRNYYGAHPNVLPPQPQCGNFGQNGRRDGGVNELNFPMNQPRSSRKTVPVNHWRISFSGDGQGLHLYDFLSQVRMLQRSEMIPDNELLPSMVHLFTGRAKNWYGRWSYSFQTWQELVNALRQEFLPENYDYIMLEKISSRKQKSNESVGEFLALMESLFMWLDVPLTEQHKVFMVKTNMLPRYAQGVAPFPIQSLAMLGQICRRIESSSSNISLGLPFESQNYAPNRSASRPRAINEIEDDLARLDLECESEVCAFKRGQKLQSSRAESNGGALTCYNCKKQGHIFRDCKEPRGGIFCFGCGVRNETTRSCTKCAVAGNANRDLQNSKDQQRSANPQQTVQPSASPAHPTV